MSKRFGSLSGSVRAAAFRAVLAGVVGAACSTAEAQTWTRLVRNAPAGVNLMLLLPDGTVMCANNNGSTIGRAWYRLTPDNHGSYVNGTWTTLTAAIDTRLYYSAQVLRDGRVFVAGGEYGTGGSHAEIYNPITNLWTAANPPTTLMNPSNGDAFVDSNSEILPDGRVIISPVAPHTAGGTVIYNPAANSWVQGPTLFRGTFQDEATWVKLPDTSFVTIDPWGQNSERYYAPTNTWINDSNLPVQMYDSFGFELGPGFLLPDGRAWIIGATGHTCYYQPSGTTAAGVWTAGPDLPSAQGAPDAPASMLITGHILLTASPAPTSANHFPTPTKFYEFDPTAPAGSAYTALNAPEGGTSENRSTYTTAMLALPDGTILFSHFGTDLYTYSPIGGVPLAQGKPVVTSVAPNGDGSYHVIGTGLNGISEGACYGDDLQMNSNYPLVRMSDASGNAYYARTFNWSNTGVMTGALPVSTEYVVPATVPAAQYSLVVVANGIPSDIFCTTPWINSQPTPSTYACPGASVALTASASGSSLTFQWKRAGAPLVDGANISGSSTATLTINPVGAGDTATDYICVVSNGCGSVSSVAASLIVRDGGYANCDFSSTPPVLNVSDFTCFLQAFAANDPYANCDGSSSPPILNVADFTCFLQKYAAGCP